MLSERFSAQLNRKARYIKRNLSAIIIKDVPILMKSKHQISILLFGLVTSVGDVMPWFIFAHNFRLNTETDIKWLEEEVLVWIERVAVGQNLCLTTEPYACHTCKRFQCWQKLEMIWSEKLSLTFACLIP